MVRRLKTLIRSLLSAVAWWSLAPLAVVAGRLRRRGQIVRCWPQAEIVLGPRVVLFMHFDRHGNVRRQLLDYIRAFRENGRDVVFVTNSGRLAVEAEAALRELCAAVVIRRNAGYDFGAWADVLDRLGLPRAETQELILANDSLFGPLVPLGDVLRRLNYAKADVWGLTESWQLRYHLQSYFLAFGPAALRTEGFTKFWRAVRPVPMKSYVIKRYEVGLTQAMTKLGLKCAALWPYEMLTAMVGRDELAQLLAEEETLIGKADPAQTMRKEQALYIRESVAQRLPLNPTSDLWRQLLLSGFPFIKRELLRDNPSDVLDVGDWCEVLREALGADPEPIRQDLRLMLKGKAP
ncbi:rhamnan synthesis F family protein [Acidocella sp.]|uniref:rhamnan synthesis F family protein n=1 Tax=Acidocella sp. TaxID=50710 RepID=UPI00261C3059|nr:rhamnan synthesis F family protein [Acidocella sp.]